MTDSGASTFSDVVADAVRRWRKARELTVEALVERCAELGAAHVTTNVIWNLESGRRRADVRGGRRSGEEH
ncbi:hypothetical protein [Stackebrandtia soli]|uniref:hypothetical protein n=1 Tax=Stackebrandtia soli TaxID=1892856 RepID=UPI0039E84536